MPEKTDFCRLQDKRTGVVLFRSHLMEEEG
jgi:hypothetical protein